MENDFCLEKKIYYHDTDAGGVVYYANYLKHLEEARTEYCAGLGVDKLKLAEAGVFFVVAHIEVNYRRPARYLDVIGVCTRIEQVGRSSVDFRQKIMRAQELLVEAKVTWVCVGADFRPCSIPADIKQIMLKQIKQT